MNYFFQKGGCVFASKETLYYDITGPFSEIHYLFFPVIHPHKVY